jgi:hypothetical protein
LDYRIFYISCPRVIDVDDYNSPDNAQSKEGDFRKNDGVAAAIQDVIPIVKRIMI